MERSEPSESSVGTKAAARYRPTIAPGQYVRRSAREFQRASHEDAAPFADFDDLFALRIREASQFHAVDPGLGPVRTTSGSCRGEPGRI